jgi:hypothetical protein
MNPNVGQYRVGKGGTACLKVHGREDHHAVCQKYTLPENVHLHDPPQRLPDLVELCKATEICVPQRHAKKKVNHATISVVEIQRPLTCIRATYDFGDAWRNEEHETDRANNLRLEHQRHGLFRVARDFVHNVDHRKCAIP